MNDGFAFPNGRHTSERQALCRAPQDGDDAAQMRGPLRQYPGNAAAISSTWPHAEAS